MTSTDPDRAQGRRMGAKARIALVAGALVVVGLLVWAIVASGSAGEGAAVASPSATADAQGSSSPAPTSSAGVATPTPTAAATQDPIASADAEPIVRETLAPVSLDEPVEVTPAILVELVSIESVTGVANIAGEVAGPALRVTVEATNTGGAAFETPAVVVNLYTGVDRLPAGTVREPGSREFPGSIAADGTASGVFIFSVPEDARDRILVEVDLQVGEPVVLFEGPVR